MLTALATHHFIHEISLAFPITGISNFLFLILLAAITDYAIWQLVDS